MENSDEGACAGQKFILDPPEIIETYKGNVKVNYCSDLDGFKLVENCWRKKNESALKSDKMLAYSVLESDCT